MTFARTASWSSLSPTMKSIRLHFAPWLSAVVIALGLGACSKSPAPRAVGADLPTSSVRVQTVGQEVHPTFEEAVGTVRAQLRAVVEAKVSGRVETMPVVAGQRVKTGDLLAQLDAAEIQARLDQALALKEQADADLLRFTALLGQEAVTRSEFDAVQARQRVALAAVNEAQTLLAYTRVIAPFDGMITRKMADVGDLAAPGRPLLEIEDPTRLRLEVSVPEALLDRLEQGGQLRVRVATLPQDLTGMVSEIAPAADPSSRTFLAKIDLPVHPGLRTGQFGRAAIPVGEFTAVRVPVGAVVQRGQLEIAFVALDGKAQLRLVKTGKQIGDALEILSGIDPGESVIIDGLADLRDGQPVRIIP